MPKRKRENKEDSGGDVVLGAQQQRIRYKLQQGTTKLGHAFKIAKGFERQKLGRRHKTAVTEEREQDVQRVESEIAALKTLDTTTSAQHYLYKTLLKIKAVAESNTLPDVVKSPAPPSQDHATLNVNARLCNSNPVKTALPAVLEDLQKALGVEFAAKASVKNTLNAKGNVKAARFNGQAVVTDKASTDQSPFSKSRPSTKKGLPEVGNTEVDFSDSEDEFEGFDDRLATSTDDEDVADDATSDAPKVEDLERQLQSEGVIRTKSKPKYDLVEDMSLSEVSLEHSPSSEPQKGPAPNKSSFIPSLSLGGYISGSGSDIDDDIDVAPKKNRRGQRARQLIWEKKFGTKAKHLQQPTTAGRNSGWDSKRGATEVASGRGIRRHGHDATNKSQGKGRVQRGALSATGANDVAVIKKNNRKDDDGPLHPSWQAKKSAKEKASIPVKFEGKKLTFD